MQEQPSTASVPARRLPSHELLISFESAARHLSFTRAAAERFVTPSAISRQIAQLEAQVGVPLFRRRHRALELTDDGRRLADATRRAWDLLRAALAEIQAPQRREVLALTTTPGMASLWLIPRLAGFLAAHPGIDVRIDATLEQRALVAEGFDLAIRYGPAARVRGEPLFQELVQPVCAPALRDDPRRPLARPADLARHTLLQVTLPPDAGIPAEWQPWLTAMGVADLRPAAMLSFSQFDEAVAAALAGQGVLLGRRPLVDALLARGELVAPFADTLATARGYFVVTDPVAARRPAVQALREWLLAQAAGRAG
jgi:LysR family transcriptional regulator, glycine cleavage system transcriptional activator